MSQVVYHDHFSFFKQHFDLPEVRFYCFYFSMILSLNSDQTLPWFWKYHLKIFRPFRVLSHSSFWINLSWYLLPAPVLSQLLSSSVSSWDFPSWASSFLYYVPCFLCFSLFSLLSFIRGVHLTVASWEAYVPNKILIFL